MTFTVNATLTGEAVTQLIEWIALEKLEGRTDFVLSSITIKPDRHNPAGLVVAAFDAVGHPFHYAVFIREDGRLEYDGY